MFNLIVAVISIALIAALAAASLFYGGDSFAKSSARAEAATLISQAQQVAGAAALFRIDNAGASVSSTEPDCSTGTQSACAITRLVDGGYLQAKPVAPLQIVSKDPLSLGWVRTWSISQDGDSVYVFLNEDNQNGICAEVERQGGAPRTSVTGTLTTEDFGLDDLSLPPFRCADLDLGGGLILTAFGYRI